MSVARAVEPTQWIGILGGGSEETDGPGATVFVKGLSDRGFIEARP
jgi:hypothetical protein